jgi:hypothetical protein
VEGKVIAIFAAIGLLVGVGGFLLGNLIGGDDPDPTGSVPTRITTGGSSTPIPTLGDAEQIPTLDLPPEESTVAEAEANAPVTESSSSAEPEEESSQPSSSSPQPEVTVAPSE